MGIVLILWNCATDCKFPVSASSLAFDASITRGLEASFGALYRERHSSGIAGAISTDAISGCDLAAHVIAERASTSEHKKSGTQVPLFR
ncbi:hypothetical protein [Paraburkholderia fungorum]|uniref:Uncharacterized protein n=1 Tax=Paraburkholderia fungorum TaxID=134537 RepID=A0A420GQ63_9BURK|nr:hypothetical protein [Paraburkholderia fungorum]RKF47227.1 hypothetical protein BCY88_23260 [Paraburkholderia fungorum]